MPDFGSFRGFGEKLVQGQTPTQLGLIGSFTTFDADAVAFFDRVTAAGGTLSFTEKDATNQLVLDLKANGTWTAMKAIYPMVGASAEACKQNLKSLSFTGSFSSGWTFASTGVTPNGINAYLDSNLNVGTQLTNNNLHISFYSRTNNTSLGYEMGILDSKLSLIARYTNGSGYTNYNGFSPFTTPNSTGLYLGSYESGVWNGYKNNTNPISITKASTTFTSTNMIIGAEFQSLSYSTKECAFSSIGDGLTPTQAGNFYTAVQAFQTTLSRQV
jgi:hypothetical protein